MMHDPHLLQTQSCPLDQGLQSCYGLVLPQQVGVEGRAGQVSVAVVREHVWGAEAPAPAHQEFGLSGAGAEEVPLRGHVEGHKHLRDLLDELQLVGELGKVLRQLDEMVVNVHKTQVGL